MGYLSFLNQHQIISAQVKTKSVYIHQSLDIHCFTLTRYKILLPRLSRMVTLSHSGLNLPSKRIQTS